MDLKIKDVADLLNVSETTIRRWLGDGKIPAYRLNQQYRFNRLEIEDWVMSHKPVKESQLAISPDQSQNSLTDNPNEEYSDPQIVGGSKQFSLYRAIHKGNVLYDIPGTTKDEFIRAAMKAISSNLNLDADIISDMLLERESLQSTGLNNGIAIPHTRDFLLNAHYDIVTVVFPKIPLDYDSLDGKPVNTLFFLFACDDKRHLHLLAKIAHLSSQPETLELLKTKPNKEQLLDYIRNWESSIQQLK
jgi:PTS system nitrogen regulatory IIA component